MEAHAEETEGAIVLDTVTLTGGDRAGGPVQGYTAKRSATGTKTDTPIARTPQSIAVVPKDQMEDQHVDSVAEALRYTPGVFADYRGASNLRDEVFVRGFYYAPRYLDGLLLSGNNASYAKIDPYLLERVELLSGPSSVLYGQGSPGGLINMVSKAPTEDPLHSVEFSYGTDRYMSASFDVSDKIPGSETVSYRLAGTGLGTVLQENFAKARSYAIAPSFTFAPDAGTTLTVLAGAQHEPKAGFRNFLDADGTVRPIAGYGYVPRDFFVSDPGFERIERDQAWIGWQFSHEIDEVFTVRQNARYHEVDFDQYTLTYGSAALSPISGARTQIGRIAGGGGGKDRWGQFGIDNQLQAEFDTGPLSHTLLAGLDYRTSSRDYTWGRNFTVPPIDLADPRYGTIDYGAVVLNPTDDLNLDARQTGLYLQDQVAIGRLDLMAGLRQDFAETDIDDHLRGATTSYSDDALSGRVGAVYTFDNGIAPYVSYSTSFEPSLQVAPKGQAPFSPTTAEQVEIGVKYAPESASTVLTAALYDLTQNDVVIGAYDPAAGAFVYRQIGEIHNRGLELSARSEITESLSLIGSYAYIDSEIVDSPDAATVGKTPARIPAHQASIWGKYTFLSGLPEGLSLAAGVRYIGKSHGNDANTFEVDAATLLDAAVTYDFGAIRSEWKGTTLQINAKNIADKTYVASCANAFACFYGSGRSVMATLKSEW